MQAPFAVSLGLVVALVLGFALWSSAPSPVRAAPRAEPLLLPVAADGEELLARSLLLLLPETQRRAAVLGERPEAQFLLRRAVPPTAIVAGRGVRFADLEPVAQAVLWRLVEQAAARHHAADAGPALQAASAHRADLSFAWAGAERLGGPCYLRLHGDRFVAEWLRTADGTEHAAWRDFANDAAEPWLADRVGNTLAPR
ncbi:MAG: DUF3500 domain-containing protein [Planctomycetes bacterium]|nr:DUF3500 domain-containing protein [Planctomycetota bacterium]